MAHASTRLSAPSFAVSDRLDLAVEDDSTWESDAYADLFAHSTAGAFEHPLWLDGFYRRLAPARNAHPVIVTGRHADGALQFVLPLILRRKNGILLLEAHSLGVSDYCAPIVRKSFVAPEDLARRVAAILPPHDILRIRPIREEATAAWQGFFALPRRRLDFSAHATDLPTTYAEWRAKAYEDRFGRYLDKKKKRFNKVPGAAVRLLNEPDEIRAAVAAIQKGRAGRFEGDLIQQDFVRDFYADIAAEGSERGLARTYAICVADEAIGHAFGLTHGGRFHYLLIACDYRTHGRHSPGLILYDGMISDWIAAGGTVFDFTIGDEPFKMDFGTHPTAMYELRALPTIRGRLAQAAFEARDLLRRRREKRAAIAQTEQAKGGD